MSVFYIGWDVGAWSCKAHKNKSCDALVILDENKNIVGFVRKPITELLNNASTTKEFTDGLLALCDVEVIDQNYKVILGVDTPLGFSNAFKNLIINLKVPKAKIDKHIENPYLFRATELFVYKTLGKRPLSPVNDMIGAQATKGIHLLSKFAPIVKETGVWCSDKANLLVFEVYPAITNIYQEVLEQNKSWNISEEEVDTQDAFKCAFIASLYGSSKDKLYHPNKSIDDSEGWIWFQK